jgi:hypothetical protein
MSLKSQARNPRLKVSPGFLRPECSGFLHPEKIHRPSNPRTLNLQASMLPRDHRGRPTLSNPKYNLDTYWALKIFARFASKWCWMLRNMSVLCISGLRVVLIDKIRRDTIDISKANRHTHCCLLQYLVSLPVIINSVLSLGANLILSLQLSCIITLQKRKIIFNSNTFHNKHLFTFAMSLFTKHCNPLVDTLLH